MATTTMADRATWFVQGFAGGASSAWKSKMRLELSSRPCSNEGLCTYITTLPGFIKSILAITPFLQATPLVSFLQSLTS